MEKEQWNSINKKQNGLIEQSKNEKSTKMYWLGGETDSAIRWRKRTGVTSPRGTAEAGC